MEFEIVLLLEGAVDVVGAFALIAALSASNNFITQSNPVMSMIAGPGGYRPRVLWQIGVPLSLMYSVIVVTMVNLLF